MGKQQKWVESPWWRKAWETGKANRQAVFHSWLLRTVLVCTTDKSHNVTGADKGERTDIVVLLRGTLSWIKVNYNDYSIAVSSTSLLALTHVPNLVAAPVWFVRRMYGASCSDIKSCGKYRYASFTRVPRSTYIFHPCMHSGINYIFLFNKSVCILPVTYIYTVPSLNVRTNIRNIRTFPELACDTAFVLEYLRMVGTQKNQGCKIQSVPIEKQWPPYLFV